MSRSIVVRQVRADEWERTGELAVAAYTAGGHADDEVEEEPNYIDVVRDVADRVEPGPVLVALSDDQIIGTATICPPGSKHSEIGVEGEVEFRYLAVDPANWGQGVAQILVDAVLDHAREVAAQKVVCCVISWNDKAHALYEKNGFVRAPHRDWAPVPGIDLWAYELDSPAS
jgi:RimJ/RimL family protein N-acetyltransferase